VIRVAHPERAWLKRQTAAYRLAYRRVSRTFGTRASIYQARRTNGLLFSLETLAMTPLRPGEPIH